MTKQNRRSAKSSTTIINDKTINESETDHLLSAPKETIPDSPLESLKTTQDNKAKRTLKTDALDTLSLSIPIFVSRLSWVGMTTIDTALVGHVGSEALAALALSDLWTMCTGVFTNGGVLSIICGQAVGANNLKLAAIYLQVSYVVLAFIGTFVIISWMCTKNIWLLFGESESLASAAGYFAFVTAFSIPAQIIFSQISQFCFAQRITKPQVISSLMALTFNLVCGLIFVVGFPIPDFGGFGFMACPIVTTLVEYANMSFLLYIFMKHHRSLWYAWDLKEITKARITMFLKLYIPATFSLASDFWRMAFIGAMAAKIGPLDVAVFNTSYRIMWITLTFTGSIAGASGIKMGLRLGSGDYIGAKQAGDVCIGVCVMMLIVIGGFLLIDIRAFGAIFSSDEYFLETLDDAKVPFVATLLFMNLACALEKIPISMGRTGEVFWLGFIGSWFGQVPGVVLLTKYWRNNLLGLYSGMAIGYLLLVILFTALVFTSNWKKYSDIARQRAEVSEAKSEKKKVVAIV